MTGLWPVREVKTRSACLDFTSAGLGRADYTQLWADNVRLCNAVELVEGGEPELQIIVCEHCGITHCEPGGWVAPRWTGSQVVLLPAFKLLAVDTEDREPSTEYLPPDYFRTHGIPILSAEVVEQLPLNRDPHALPLVSGAELVWWTQWSAPWRLLGRFPEAPTVRRDACVAVSDGPLEAAVDTVLNALAECAPTAAFTLRPPATTETSLTFYVDAAGSPEWRPLVRAEEGDLLSPVPGLVAELAVGTDVSPCPTK